jgi:excinuclease ABC subunit A
MQFIADIYLECDSCKGKRYKNEILEVKFNGKDISDVLAMSISDAIVFFKEFPKITQKLKILEDVGLGYLRLGQSATTLSGGEAQRMKLAAHLQPRSQVRVNGEESKRRRRILYIFDEPTTGLHFDDVSKLLAAFRRLIDAGGSIVVIEHNLDVVKVADWVIDLGPEGGARGGQVVGTGTPEQIARIAKSYTGKWLSRILPLTENVHSNAS